MLIKNEFTTHKDIADKAIIELNKFFPKAIDLLSLFEVRYLVADNSKNYQGDLLLKFKSSSNYVSLREAVLSPNVVGQTSGKIITYNSLALNVIDETDIARLAANIAHEIGHLFGYYHNSRRFFINTSNWYSTDKAIHSIPYLLGFIMYCLILNKTDIKAEVYKIAYAGGNL